jgi:succinate dehydrogenase / fumarate reductase cytochrome b subunit
MFTARLVPTAPESHKSVGPRCRDSDERHNRASTVLPPFQANERPSMASQNRPLSPHLQVYKPQISSVLSILHRLAGIGLGLGAVLLAWWLIAAASGPEAFAAVQAFLGSILGRLLLFGFSVALFYHLSNGIRHLVWDAGYGFELPVMAKSGWAVVVATGVLTLVAWFAGYAMRGGA